MFNKTTLNGRLPNEVINRINENFEFLFNGKSELSNPEIVEHIVNKALALKEVDNVIKKCVESNDFEELETVKEVTELENETSNDADYKDVTKENLIKSIPSFLYNLLKEHSSNSEIQKFYKKEKNSLPIDTENEEENIMNLLLNFYVSKFLGSYPQPLLSNRQKRKAIQQNFAELQAEK